MRALLIDDDIELARLLGEYLGPHGVELEPVETGALGLERLESRAYDVVLLDVMLPGADGFEICRRIRRKHDVPIVMLTARGDDTDWIVGLELGADDYLPKPFNPRELLARVRAVMRRARPGAVSERLTVGTLDVDVPGHRVTVSGKEVSLHVVRASTPHRAGAARGGDGAARGARERAQGRGRRSLGRSIARRPRQPPTTEAR